MDEKKRFFTTLRLLFAGAFISGFLLAFITIKLPSGLELVGYISFFGLWMIVAVSSYIAIKSYFYNK